MTFSPLKWGVEGGEEAEAYCLDGNLMKSSSSLCHYITALAYTLPFSLCFLHPEPWAHLSSWGRLRALGTPAANGGGGARWGVVRLAEHPLQPVSFHALWPRFAPASQLNVNQWHWRDWHSGVEKWREGEESSGERERERERESLGSETFTVVMIGQGDLERQAAGLSKKARSATLWRFKEQHNNGRLST